MKSLILKVTSMRKLTNLVGDVLLDFSNIIFIQKNYIHKTKLSITFKYHWFEVVTFEILDFEGYMYEKVHFFSWRCALGPQ